MGWAYGINAEGREVGYSVEATCDHEDCHKQIDRGLSFVCGGMHDGDNHGCGKYFCDEHLTGTVPNYPGNGYPVRLCAACERRYYVHNPMQAIQDGYEPQELTEAEKQACSAAIFDTLAEGGPAAQEAVALINDYTRLQIREGEATREFMKLFMAAQPS